MYRFFSFLFALLSFLGTTAQESAPLIRFTPNDYGAENQNWGVTQDKNGFIYVANNAGLLVYDGARWSLYPSPNKSVPRSVLAIEDTIYMGSFMEFGFYVKEPNGNYRYTSLSKKLDSPLLEDENFWHIKAIDHWVVFQSYDRLYFYDRNTGKTHKITDKNNFYRIFELENTLFTQKKDGRIVRLENGREQLITRIPPEFNVRFVMNFFKTETGYRFVTRNQGIFDISDSIVSKVVLDEKNRLDGLKVFSAVQLADNSLVLGTISEGIFHLSQRGRLLEHIDQSNGLNNNTVLNLFIDRESNVWMALDNGIACLNLSSYIREYTDNGGTLGTVYCSAIVNGRQYIGSNQGLFYKNTGKNGGLKLVENSKGQVWSLFNYGGELFCGHNDGVFIISGDTAKRIEGAPATWDFRKLPDQPDKLILGHYSGMGILQHDNGIWNYANRIKGFDNSARFFEISETGEVWVNHENKGIYRLKSSADFKRFVQVQRLKEMSLGKGSGLAKFNDTIYYKYEEGVFKWGQTKKTFVKDSFLSKLTPAKDYLSGVLIKDDKKRIWAFNKNAINYAENSPIPGEKVIKSIPITDEWRKIPVSFENIQRLHGDTYLIGKTDGYVLVDISASRDNTHHIFLDKAMLTRKDSGAARLNLRKSGEFKVADNSISFFFSVPRTHKYEDVLFSHRLLGFRKKWSPWSKKASVGFENLSSGSYTFEVRSQIGEKMADNTASYSFTISRPLYLSNTAIVLYILALTVLVIITHRSYKAYYRRVHEKRLLENQRRLEYARIEAEKELEHMRNEKLNSEIKAKNRELAISMMNISKRNKVLKSIKKELKQNTDLNENAPIFNLIKKNQDNAKDWSLFKEAFDHADRDFFKRAKAKHPNLTANDLRFCAYLRLNLSSKEIAPLFGISVKSVEVKRYRLRKKLNLAHDINLTDHILSI